MRHEGPFFLFKSEKKTDEGQLKQMRQVPENLFFFFFWPKQGKCDLLKATTKCAPTGVRTRDLLVRNPTPLPLRHSATMPLQYTANLMAVKGSSKSNLFCFSLDTCVFKALINTSICRLPSSVIIITMKISFSCD